MGAIPEGVLDALGDVYDPCCREKGISIVDMGLIHSVRVDGRQARVELLLTTGWCPFAARVLDDVRERVEALPDIESATVDVVWTQPWTIDRLAPSARAKLRFLPDPVDVPDRDAFIAGQKGVRS